MLPKFVQRAPRCITNFGSGALGMFTGIVTDMGEVIAMQPAGEGLHRLKIACRYERASIAEGASIACSGVCLTVVGTGEEARS